MKQNPSFLKAPVCQGHCFLIFTGFIGPKFFWLQFLRDSAPFLFQTILVVMGIISWTFCEYILHRFWMHGKHDHAASGNDRLNHQHHHTHPTDIRITGFQRRSGILLATAFLMTGYLLNNYFSLFSGFFAGFTGYGYMHWALHQPWSARIFPALQRQHIHHHLKFPNLCFGVTSTFWDRIFHTQAPKGAVVSDKAYQFYLKGNQKSM